MKTVEKLLQNKPRDIWAVDPDDTVFDAIKLMEEKEIGAVLVMDDDRLVGILSERDYTRKVILRDRSSKQTLAKEIMTRNVFYAHPEQDVHHCLTVMSQQKIRHLPVIQDEKVIGMISVGDVVREIIAEQQYKIEKLEQSLVWSESY